MIAYLYKIIILLKICYPSWTYAKWLKHGQLINYSCHILCIYTIFFVVSFRTIITPPHCFRHCSDIAEFSLSIILVPNNYKTLLFRWGITFYEFQVFTVFSRIIIYLEGHYGGNTCKKDLSITFLHRSNLIAFVNVIMPYLWLI